LRARGFEWAAVFDRARGFSGGGKRRFFGKRKLGFKEGGIGMRPGTEDAWIR
jgi:hypothetical protein